MNERKVIYKGNECTLIQIDNIALPDPRGLSGMSLNVISFGTIIDKGVFKVVNTGELTDSVIVPLVSDTLVNSDVKI